MSWPRAPARPAGRALWPASGGPALLHHKAILGRIALEAGQRQEALAEFRGVAGSPDADVPNTVSAAWGLYMAGEGTDAAGLVERAITADPSYGNAYHLRGWMRLAAGHHAAAADDLPTAFGADAPPLRQHPPGTRQSRPGRPL